MTTSTTPSAPAIPDAIRHQFRHSSPADLAQMARKARSRHGVGLARVILALQALTDALNEAAKLRPSDCPAGLFDSSYARPAEVFGEMISAWRWAVRMMVSEADAVTGTSTAQLAVALLAAAVEMNGPPRS